MKVNSKEKLAVKYSILKALSKNFEVLTDHGDNINPKIAQKGSNWYFMYQLVVYETILSKFGSYDSFGDVINPKLAQKVVQTCISSTNGDPRCISFRRVLLNINPMGTFTSRHFGSVLILKFKKNTLTKTFLLHGSGFWSYYHKLYLIYQLGFILGLL